jgi:predicted alpha/beta hydrolase
MKGSFDLSQYRPKGVGVYLIACATCLARAHARSGDATAISSYMGKGNTFDKAIGQFAVAYADQAEKDYQALLDAINEGRIVAEPGV